MSSAHQKLQVLSSTVKKGIGSKSNKPYEMTVCQCVLTNANGEVVVGEVILPKEHPACPPGMYTVTTELGKGANGGIEGKIVALAPIPVAQARAA